MQKQQIQLQQEEWKVQKQQQDLEYKFDIMLKYKRLKNNDLTGIKLSKGSQT
jgi:hypothetical protein